MDTLCKSCISLAVLMWSLAPAQADMLSKTYLYDQKAGTFTVVIIEPGVSSETYSMDLDLNYQATNAIFSAISLNTSASSSFAASNQNGQGEVHASALNVKSEGGGIIAKMIFSTEGPAVFKGEITSLKINGAEYGPLALPLYEMSRTDVGSGSDRGAGASPTISPDQVIAFGINHAVQVVWSHPDDNVLYYQVVAHHAGNDATSLRTAGRFCLAHEGQKSCTIRGLKNGVPVAVVVTAVYPDGVAEVSETSNIVIPQLLRRLQGLPKGS